MKHKRLPQKFQKDFYQANKSKINSFENIDNLYKIQKKKEEYKERQEATYKLLAKDMQEHANEMNSYIKEIEEEDIIKMVKQIQPYSLQVQKSNLPQKNDEFGYAQRDLVDEIILSNEERTESKIGIITRKRLSGIEKIFLN